MEIEIHATIHHHDVCMIDRFGLTTSSSVKTFTDGVYSCSVRVTGYLVIALNIVTRLVFVMETV
jgi:hypothetical protein